MYHMERSYGEGPGAWWLFEDDDGDLEVMLACPDAHPFPLPSGCVVDERGEVRPEVGCPECGFRSRVTLVGWEDRRGGS